MVCAVLLWFILLLDSTRSWILHKEASTSHSMFVVWLWMSVKASAKNHFLVSLTVQVTEWNQTLSLCFSSRFSCTSKLWCGRLRYKADKSGITLVEGVRKISKKHKCSLVFPLLLLAPSSSLSHSPFSTHLRISKKSSQCRVWDYLIRSSLISFLS